MTIEVREATPGEFAEAGRVTADAYREFVRDGDDDWRAYLTHIADVEGRADRTTILVAVEEGQILGSATLELFDRVEPEDDPTLHPDEAHVRMVGVDPLARRRGIARALFDRCFELAREQRQDVRDAPHHGADEDRAADVRGDGVPTPRRPRVPRRLRAADLPDRALGAQATVSSTAGTTSPVASSTPSSNSASTRPPRNCCS